VQTTPTGAPAGVHAQPHQPVHVWDYWAIVMKRLILVLAFILLSVGGAYFITQKQQKLYRATATVQILPPSLLRSSQEFAPTIVSDEIYLATQLVILTNAETIDRAVRESNLVNLPDFQGKSEAEIQKMAYGKVEAGRRRGVYLVDVSVTGPEPKVLDDLANALVKTFKDMQKSESKQLRDARKAALDEKISSADSAIRLATLDKTNALAGANFTETTFESDYKRILDSSARFEAEDDNLVTDLLKREPQVKRYKEARQDPSKGVGTLAQDRSILLDPRIRELDAKIVVLKEHKDALLRQGLRPNHEGVLAADEQINAALRERDRAILDVADTSIIQYEEDFARHERLQKQIEQKTAERTAAANVKARVDAINSEIKLREANKSNSVHELEILTQLGDGEREAVEIQAAANEPQAPFSPNQPTNLMLGLILGIVGGVGLAFLLDYLDDTIRTKDELAKIAPDVPLLGIVPNIEARKSDTAKKDLFAANQPKSTISEAYRGVRTALTLSARGPQQKAMLLTSAGPREGKTTTALNLATVLAFSGARTLIIDADLRKPRAHASFNLPNKRGLTNLIVGEDDPVDYCQRTSIERVDVLTSGPIPPNPSELLGRPRMREILRKLRDRYDQIIVDTPPIGAVTDAAVLATMVDGVILVVHAGKTRRQIVSRGLEQLRYISAPIVGVILNNLKLGRGRYYPGYYHYYYYYTSHYGAEDGESKKKGKKSAAAPETPGGGDATVG
jgi:succinoglycan biosynthesis transport protein ExoP